VYISRRVVKGLKGGGADALDVPRVEKFVRGDVLQVRRGRCVDRGAIGVLHATAGAVSGFPRVENEGVVVVRSAVHHFDFVVTILRSALSNIVFFPLSQDDHANRW